MHSFEALDMDFGYFVQHSSPLKKHYWYFVYHPLGQPQAQKGVGKWSPEGRIHSFETLILVQKWQLHFLSKSGCKVAHNQHQLQ